MVTSNDEHWYPSPSIEGVYYPSVTTILSIWPKGVGFNRWLAAQGSYEESQDVMHKAGDRGTRVHKTTEMLEQGATISRDDFSIEEWQMLMGFLQWRAKYKPEIIRSERSYVSDGFETGGTVDRIYKIDGKNVLLDIKTSSALHENYWVQVGTYAAMVGEKEGINIDSTAVLRLTTRRKDLYEYKTKDNWIEDAALFQSVRDIWTRLNPGAKGPKLLELPVTLSLQTYDIVPETKKRAASKRSKTLPRKSE